jgi:phage gp45-like
MNERKLWGRIWSLLGFGSLTVINDTGTVQTAQLKLNTSEMRDGVPVVQLFGLSGNPPAGTDAVALFLGGDRSNAVVIATNHQGSRPTGRAPGETTLYNNFLMSIYLSQNGPIVQCAGKPMLVEGDLHVTGEVIRGYGGVDQVTLGGHKHNQPPDTHGDTEQPTNAPTPGT